MALHTRGRTDGGMDLTIRLTAAEVDAIGPAEAEGLVDWFDTALWGLAMLRTGRISRGPDDLPITCAEVDTVIRDLHVKLLPRFGGIHDAAIRRHTELGGTVSALAAAMDAPRSTAQTRREALDRPGPRRAATSAWEDWATTARDH